MERGLSCGLRAWLAPCDQPMPLTGCDPHPLAVLLVLYVTKTDCALTNKRCRLGPRGPPNRARGVRLAPREGWEGPLRCGRVQTCYSGGYVQSSNACARLQHRQLQRCSAPLFLGAAVRLAAAFTRHPLAACACPACAVGSHRRISCAGAWERASTTSSPAVTSSLRRRSACRSTSTSRWSPAAITIMAGIARASGRDARCTTQRSPRNVRPRPAPA